MVNLASACTAAFPVMIEMGHFRQFKFDDFFSGLDAFDAIAKGADQGGDFPVMHDCEEHLVIVDEENGEAAMRFLKAAGIEFKYERVWRPVDEVWIDVSVFNPADELAYDLAA